MKNLPFKIQSVCVTCRQEFGDHKSYRPHPYPPFHCQSFIPVMSTSPRKPANLRPVKGCSNRVCHHAYCSYRRSGEDSTEAERDVLMQKFQERKAEES